jgi:hypothetical protein
LQLPAEDMGCATQVASKLGLTVDEVEVRKGLVDGWALVKADGKNGGAAYEKRLTLQERGEFEIRARFHDNGRAAMLGRGNGHWLIATFDVGHSYEVMLRKETRKMISEWIGQEWNRGLK